MPALTKSSLAQLGGDQNVLVVDLTFGSSWNVWNTYAAPTGRLVTQALNNQVTFSGDASPFVTLDYVNFPDDPTNSAYQIMAISGNTLTLSSNLPTPVASKIVGDNINVSIDLTGATFSWLLQEYKSSGVTETRTGLDLGVVTIVTPVVSYNFSSYITLVNPTQGRVKINVPPTAFTIAPTPADAPLGTTPIIFAGSIIVNVPAGTDPVANPPLVYPQRAVFLLWSNLSPASA
jgi:hypothetical protein